MQNDGQSKPMIPPDRFKLGGVLGKGGMGIVYEALDSATGRTVALKTLLDNSLEYLLGLKKEFRSLAEVRHRNLIRYGELFEHRGNWFFSMELLRGKTLLRALGVKACDEVALVDTGLPTADLAGHPFATKPLIAHNPASIGEAACDVARLRIYLLQAAEGLRELHDNGKVHGDVKPSNLFVTDSGRIVLLDFGLSRDLRTDKGEVVLSGTLPYMAPELFSGSPPGPSADMYALGIVIYRALTETFPFSGTAGEVIEQKRLDKICPLEKMISDAPPDLLDACRELTRPEPERRPGAAELLQLLGRRSAVVLTRQVFFVGREPELKQMLDGVEKPKDGPRVTFIHGESAIGKSALLNRFADIVAERFPDVVILRSACRANEHIPFNAFDSVVDGLASYLSRRRPADRAALVALISEELATTFPALAAFRTAETEHGSDENEPHGGRRERVVSAISNLFAKLSESGPVVIVLDDIHAGDIDSHWLLRRLLANRTRFYLVATLLVAYAADDWLLQAHHALTGVGVVDHLLLGPLKRKEAIRVAEYFLERQGELNPDAARAAAAVAGGNPGLIEQLIAAAPPEAFDAGNPREVVRRAMTERIDALDAPHKRVLWLLAIARRPLGLDVLLAASRIPAAEFHKTLDALVDSRVLRRTGNRASDSIQLANEMVREHLAAGLEPQRHPDLHRALGFAEQRFGGSIEVRAHHWQLAGEADKACALFLEAADLAMGQLAYQLAARLLTSALKECSGNTEKRIEVLRRLVAARRPAGELAAAAEDSLELSTLVPAEEFSRRREAAEMHLKSGFFHRGLELLDEILVSRGRQLPKTRAESIRFFLWQRFRIWLRGRRFKEQDSAKIPQHVKDTTELYWSAGNGLLVIDFVAAGAFTALHYREALDSGDLSQIALGTMIEAAFQAIQGSREKAGELFGVAEALSVKVPEQPFIQASLYAIRGASLILAGELRKGLEQCLHGETELVEKCPGRGWEINSMRIFIRLAWTKLGEFESLLRWVPVWKELASSAGDVLEQNNLLVGTGHWTRLIKDQPREALRDYEESLETMRNLPTRLYRRIQFDQLVSFCDTQLYLGQAGVARDAVEQDWKALKKSQLLRVRSLATDACLLRGRCALAAEGSPKETGRIVDRCIRSLRRYSSEESLGAAALLEAGRRALEKSISSALAALETAEKHFARGDLLFLQQAARWGRGKLLGSEGLKLCEDSSAWARARGVVAPNRLFATFAVGFAEHPVSDGNAASRRTTTVLQPFVVSVSEHLTRERLARVISEIDGSQSTHGGRIVLDCRSMPGYDAAARGFFTAWLASNKSQTRRVAVVTDSPAWLRVVATMSVVTGTAIRGFRQLSDALDWALDAGSGG